MNMAEAVPAPVAPTLVQREGQRPPGLPRDLRQHPAWERLRQQIYRRAIRFGTQLSFDFRELLTDAENARDAGLLLWRLIRPLAPEVLVGPGFGATPLLYATALAALADGHKLQVLMVRDQRKGHNKKRWVEGHHESARGKRAVMLDDFMKSGSAVPLVRQALAADKVPLDIAAVVLFFDMWEPLGSRQVSTSQYPVLSLFTRHDVGVSRDAFDAVPPLMKGAAPDFFAGEPRWWRFALNRNTGYPTKSAPAILDGGVFVADDRSRLWRHDARTGEVSWCVESLAEPRKGIVQLLQAVDASVVYGCYDGTLTRVRASDGEILWRWRLDSSIHATPWVDVAAGRVFVNTEQWNEGAPTGHLQCLDWTTGRVLWKQRHGWWPPGSAAVCPRSDVVVAPCNDGSLGAWTASTGEPLWKRKDAGLVRGRPLIDAGRVLFASEQGRVHCWDLRTGQPVWSTRYGKPLWHQFITAGGGELLVMDGKWHLSAFDLATGELRWLTRLRSAGCWMPVRCGAHVVVLSREGHLAVIDPAQQVKVWEGRLPGTFEQPPAVGEGLLVAAGSSGLVAHDIHPSYEH
jgi:outer membrane protein assembly factor BamB/orotate phosphoribosyltransferase